MTRGTDFSIDTEEEQDERIRGQELQLCAEPRL